MPRSQLQLVRLHTGPLRAWQLASLRCPRPIRSRPLAASWDSSIHHSKYSSQASTPSPCCGYGRLWERKGRLLRRSLASSQNRDVELADIASAEAATLDVHRAYGTAATLRKGRAKLMRHKALLGVLVGAVLVLAAGCTSSTQEHKASTQEKAATQEKASTHEHKAYTPHINPSEFTTKVDNEYLPLKPGTTFLYEGGAERDQMSVTHQTKKVMGVECVVVDDRAWEGGKLIEKTYDWFAQDNEGTVWYFGEDTKEYENGKVVSTKGSWEAGVDGAKPGILMQADPKVGASYRQEYYPGEAMDMARVLSLNASVTVPYGTFDHALETKEWTPLQPGFFERKYYVRGVGPLGNPGDLALSDVKHR